MSPARSSLDSWRSAVGPEPEALAALALVDAARRAVRDYLASELDESADRARVHLRSVAIISRLATTLGVEIAPPAPSNSSGQSR